MRHRNELSVEEAAGDTVVRVDSAVAEEGPVLAGNFGKLWVDFSEEDRFFGMGGFGENAAEGVSDEGTAPELEAGGLVCLMEGAVDED